jgi:hypothetical protein
MRDEGKKVYLWPVSKNKKNPFLRYKLLSEKTVFFDVNYFFKF